MYLLPLKSEWILLAVHDPVRESDIPHHLLHVMGRRELHMDHEPGNSLVLPGWVVPGCCIVSEKYPSHFRFGPYNSPLVREAPHWKYDISGLGSEIKRDVLILANTVSSHSLPGKALVSNTAWQMRFSLLSVLQQAFLSVVLQHSCLICYQLSAPETWSFRKAKSSSASIVHVVV